MKNTIIKGLAFGLFTVLLVAGCSSNRYSYDSEAADRALASTVRAEVNRYGDLAAAATDLRVHAHNGVVTIRGEVPGERERQMIDDVVRNTSGVVALNDQLKLRYPGATAPRIYSPPTTAVPEAAVVVPGAAPLGTPPPLVVQATTDEERRIADKVVYQLRRDDIPSSSLRDVNIAVVNGADVHLRGYVQDPAVREATLSSVRRIAGVRAVYDELQIR